MAEIRVAREVARLKDLYVELLSLSKVLADLAGRRNWEAFDDAWIKREKIYGKIVNMHSQLAPVFDNWEKYAEPLEPGLRKDCEQYFTIIKEMTAEIQAQDEITSAGLESGMGHLMEHMGRIKEGGRALNAYAGPKGVVPPSGGFRAKG